MVNKMDNDHTSRLIIREEVLEVLKIMTKDKSPGQYEWSMELFLHFQDIMIEELMEMDEESR